MRDLIAKLEAATGPDRELDLQILRASGGNDWYWMDRERELITRDKYGKGALGNPVCSLDRFTASLDDALTEAHKQGFISALGDIAADGLPGCCICVSTDPVRHVWGVSAAGDDPIGRLARATIAAALRARMGDDND